MPCAERRRRLARGFFAALCVGLFAGPAVAHPLAPGLLDLRERDDGTLRLLFKLPRKRELGVRLVPRLPEGCRALSQREGDVPANAVATIQEVDCGGAALVGKSLGVDGIERSRSGVLARVQLAGSAAQSRMLGAAEPSIVIDAAPTAGSVLREFAALGVRHLVTGVDHVLFLLALTLLVGWGRRLFWTLTSFTLGHSVTLSLAALGYVDFPVAFVESLIAFSIVVAAAEIAQPERPGWFARRPELAAGAFGLLHGMGFAGALAEVGLPTGEIPVALLAFNLGIEGGQLLVVAAVLLAARLLAAPLRAAAPQYWRRVAGYALGTIAAVWFWQRSGLPSIG